jgi:hypothetical protein
MKDRFRILRAEINEELGNLERLNHEVNQLLSGISGEPTFVSVRATGSILHDFYCGAEKIFQKIALEVDGELPKGEDWHTELLKRMTIAIPTLREAVISKDLAEELDEFLRFRHLFRNIYGFELRWARCKELTKRLSVVLQKLTSQLHEFFQFLDSLADE